MKQLLEMLSWARPAHSRSEATFVERYIKPHAPDVDGYGNHYIRIGDQPTLWSCHTDTRDCGQNQKAIQLFEGVVRLREPKAGMCLGADDTVGVWIMLSMIRAQRPGLYVFHRAEEIGGLGSTWIAENARELLDGIQHAIALDRKGTGSIITHQLGARCCSTAFTQALSDELGRVGLDYRADSTGLFTDTANYMYLVPECTNLSVGYEREHGPTENLDAIHAGWLRGAMLKFDASGLPARRDPSAEATVANLYAANDDLHRHYGSEVDEGLLECVL